MSTFPYVVVIFKWLYIAFNAAFIAWLYFSLRGPGISRLLRVGICLFAVVLALALPVARSLSGNAAWIKTILIVGQFWFAFTYHALLAWILLCIFRLFNWRFRWLVIAEEDRARWRHQRCAGIVVVSLIVCAAGWINMQYLVVRKEKLPVPADVAPLRIVALSDLHLGRLASVDVLADVVDLIKPLSPDVVLLLGDILEHDFDPSEVPAARAVMQQLKPRLGIWGVMGNHEYIEGKGLLNKNMLNEIGIHMLLDQWVMLGEKPSEKFMLIGRKDRHAGAKPIQTVIANVPEADRDALKILLDHQPSKLKGAEEAGVYLQLSGHTHNGQFFPINFIVSILFENAYGYYRRGQTHYWASSGAGAWGPRVRTTGRPEILMIDLIPLPGVQRPSALQASPK